MHARLVAVQSRVAAPVVSVAQSATADLRFCGSSTMVHTGAASASESAKGLLRHITHHLTGSVVDDDTCALFTAIERVTCSTPSCGGLRRSGARVCDRCGLATPARPPAVGYFIMARPRPPLVWLAPRMAPLHTIPGVHIKPHPPAARTDGLHPEDPFVTGQHLAPSSPSSYDRGLCAVIVATAWPTAATTSRC